MGKSQEFFWGNGERGAANAADRDPSPPAERRESVPAWTPSAPRLIGEPACSAWAPLPHRTTAENRSH